MELHTQRLQKLCRICTRKLERVSHDCRSTLLEEYFQDGLTFNPAVHPPRFCNSCYLTMRCTLKARQDGSVHRTSLTLYSWEEHQEGNCGTCDMVVGRSVGGRPKKKKNIKRCPTYLTAHIQAIAGPRHRCSAPLPPDWFLSCSEPGLGLYTDDVTCRYCNSIVAEPVELPPRVPGVLFTAAHCPPRLSSLSTLQPDPSPDRLQFSGTMIMIQCLLFLAWKH